MDESTIRQIAAMAVTPVDPMDRIDFSVLVRVDWHARMVGIIRAQRRRTVNQRRALRELGDAFASECLISELHREEAAELRARISELEQEIARREHRGLLARLARRVFGEP